MLRAFFKDLLNIPNTVSLFRIIVTPLLIILWVGFDWKIVTLVIGTVAGLTDQLDGYLARKLNQTTELGGLIDQLGDLVFESTCLTIGILAGEMWSGLLIIYLFREFTVSVVRAYVVGHGGTVPSSGLGKTKSSCIQWAFFPFFLGAILLDPGVIPESWSMVGVPPGRWLYWLAKASIYPGLLMGYLSAGIYLRAFAEFYVERKKRRS
ncbi:MAG: CDP-alcohol phosphatidyltransferase family protein [Proteobacteria bacterium]|nr:CDP-alcohol phosphatidyltransferase family protein [Pseudomonadota bacterium]